MHARVRWRVACPAYIRRGAGVRAARWATEALCVSYGCDVFTPCVHARRTDSASMTVMAGLKLTSRAVVPFARWRRLAGGFKIFVHRVIGCGVNESEQLDTLSGCVCRSAR